MEEREKKKRRERKTNEWKIHEFAYVRRVWFISFWVEKNIQCTDCLIKSIHWKIFREILEI